MPSNSLLLSLMLVPLLWYGSQAKALPLREDGQTCRQLAKAVLSNISELLEDEQQYKGFNCSEMTAQTHNKTSTVSACAPAGSGNGCSGQVSQNTQFNETDCLENIRADVEYYKSVLEAYPHFKLTQIVVATSNMLEKCNWQKKPESTPTSEKMWPCGTAFDDRVCLCKVVKGFQLRAVTITRALNYIALGEQKK